MEYTKTVVPTVRQVLPRRRVRGWVEDFTTDAYVLLLEGETHLSRKPVRSLLPSQSCASLFFREASASRPSKRETTTPTSL